MLIGAGISGGLVAVEISHEGFDAAFVAHLFALLDRMARVGQDDGHAGIQEGEFAQPVLKRREVELDHGEGLGRRQERHLGALAAFDLANDRQRRLRDAIAELHRVFFAVAPDRELQPGRERVDHRHADAVQSAGDLVGILVELSAGMKLRHDHFGGRNTFVLVDVGRDAAAIVAHGAGAVRIERHGHFRRVASQRFVDRVVDDLVDHVVQAGPVVGVADIHARTLAHGIEALENLDRFRIVVSGRIGCVLAGGLSHQAAFESVCKKGTERDLRATKNWGRIALFPCC